MKKRFYTSLKMNFTDRLIDQIHPLIIHIVYLNYSNKINSYTQGISTLSCGSLVEKVDKVFYGARYICHRY